MAQISKNSENYPHKLNWKLLLANINKISSYSTYFHTKEGNDIYVVIDYEYHKSDPDVGIFNPSIEIKSIKTDNDQEIDVDSLNEDIIIKLENEIMENIEYGKGEDAEYDRIKDDQLTKEEDLKNRDEHLDNTNDLGI